MGNYELGTLSLGLKIEQNRNEKNQWDIVSNGNYVGNLVMISNISGCVLYVLGVPVSWRSKAQRSITQSSSQAEQRASLEVVNEFMFVIQLLRSMKFPDKLNVEVRVDYASVFMAGNITATSCTKHF